MDKKNIKNMKNVTIFDVNTDEAFFDEIINVKNDIQNIASMFQNQGSQTNTTEILEWVNRLDFISIKIQGIKDKGLSRFTEAEYKL